MDESRSARPLTSQLPWAIWKGNFDIQTSSFFVQLLARGPDCRAAEVNACVGFDFNQDTS
jgi:hypothetical protein